MANPIGSGQSAIAAPVREYDPKDVSVSVDGVVITGLADGTFVTCEKTEDSFEPYVGALGEVVRAHNAHPLGTITLTLDHTSPSNSHLKTLSNRKSIFPAKVVDMNTNGDFSVGGSECWIQKPANIERAGDVSDMEWTIVVADYQVI